MTERAKQRTNSEMNRREKAKRKTELKTTGSSLWAGWGRTKATSKKKEQK